MTGVSLYFSPVGTMALVSDGEKLLRLTFNPSLIDGRLREIEDDITLRTKSLLDRYFSGLNPDFDVPLSLSGTPFRVEVWKILETIPYGKTTTYGSIASILAGRRGIKKMSAQAVGGAVGANPFPIIIPCHRVLGKGGELVGYSEGLDKKIALLELEGIAYRK